MKLIDGVYAYPWTNMMENNCNTYVLQGPEGLILIDPGLGRYVPDTIEAIKKDGLNPDDIKLVHRYHILSYPGRDKKLTLIATALKEQGKFWPWLDFVFKNNGKPKPEKIEKFLKDM